jgi:hypothetical protein
MKTTPVMSVFKGTVGRVQYSVGNVDLDEVIEFFDATAKECLLLDMGGLELQWEVIRDNSEKMRTQAALLVSDGGSGCSSGGGGSHGVTRSKHNVRVGEQVDALAKYVGDIVRPTLLDGDFVRSLVKDLKVRIRTVQANTMSSTKTTKGLNAQGQRVSATLKELLQQTAQAVELMDVEAHRHSNVLDLLNDVKARVHKPVRELAEEQNAIWALQQSSTGGCSGGASTPRSSAAQGTGALAVVEEAYEGARSAPVLVRVVDTRAQAEMLVMHMTKTLHPLYAVFQTNQHVNLTGGTADSLLVNMRRMFDLQGDDLLANLMINDNARTELAEVVAELQARVRMRSPGGEALDAVAAHVRDLDLELLFAQLADWKEWMEELVRDQASPEFEGAVLHLQQCRQGLEEAIARSDEALSTQSSVSARYDALKARMGTVKADLELLALREFATAIQVILPSDMRPVMLMPGTPTASGAKHKQLSRDTNAVSGGSAGGSGKKKLR